MQKATDRKPRADPTLGLQKRCLGEGSRGSHVDQHPFRVPLAPYSASQCLSFPICEHAPLAIAAVSTNTGASVTASAPRSAGRVTPGPRRANSDCFRR